LPPQSVHLIVSDVVFEYLSPEELFDILQEFRRIAAPDAVMRHTISIDDQYAAYDSGSHSSIFYASRNGRGAG